MSYRMCVKLGDFLECAVVVAVDAHNMVAVASGEEDAARTERRAQHLRTCSRLLNHLFWLRTAQRKHELYLHIANTC